MGLQPWSPSLEAMSKVLRSCPRLDTMRLLLDDAGLSVVAEALVNHPEDVEVENLEVHCSAAATASDNGLYDSVTSGIALMAVGVGQYLTTLTLILLDPYTWSFIQGKLGRMTEKTSSHKIQ